MIYVNLRENLVCKLLQVAYVNSIIICNCTIAENVIQYY